MRSFEESAEDVLAEFAHLNAIASEEGKRPMPTLSHPEQQIYSPMRQCSRMRSFAALNCLRLISVALLQLEMKKLIQRRDVCSLGLSELRFM